MQSDPTVDTQVRFYQDNKVGFNDFKSLKHVQEQHLQIQLNNFYVSLTGLSRSLRGLPSLRQKAFSLQRGYIALIYGHFEGIMYLVTFRIVRRAEVDVFLVELG